MSEARYIIGDTRDVTATLADNSVDLVLTSPPFLALRSYLPDDHPDKHREIGSEPTPAAFLDALLALSAEWDRVLAPHGSICIELGDTYSGSGGGGGDYMPGGLKEGQPGFTGSAKLALAVEVQRAANAAHWRQKNQQKDAWPLAKSLTLIPELYRLGLAYGINPLTGQPSPAGKWRVRNVVRWHRPNPPVGALGDKFRPATTDMVIATKAAGRYFDLDAVREARKPGATLGGPREFDRQGKGRQHTVPVIATAGAPPLDTWTIPTHPYKDAHYATWPPDLCIKPIKAMVPEKVCTECGEPSRRIVDVGYLDEKGNPAPKGEWKSGVAEGKGAHSLKTECRTTTTTIGWTDCNHDAWRKGIVLDPFAGSGTTLMVATGLGRDAIGIDIDARNADLARERVGMFLTVEDDK